MQETGNYKLKKPAGTDIVNIDDLNANSDIIDRELANKAQKEHTHSSYVNQNAFSNVKVGNTTIIADNTTDTLTLAAGSNVTLTPDATNDKITISATDTKYTHPSYTSKTNGLYKVTVDGTGHVSATSAVTKADITNLGIPAQDTNTTYGVATASTLGLVKSGTDITVDASGNVFVVDDSHNHVISNVDGLQTALNGKAASSHAHLNYMNQNAEIFDNTKSFNTYTTAGQYDVRGCYNISDLNGPNGAYYNGRLLVFTSKAREGADYGSVTQLYLSDYTSRIYYRMKQSWDWDSWYEIKDTVYIHPAYTSKTNGLYKVTVDGTGHVSATSAVTKADITALGIPAQDTNTTYGVVTTSTNGLMSSADKSKLNGIATNANKYTHPSYTSKTNGLYKITVDTTGHISATNSVTKADITNLGIASTSSPVFTSSMSMTRKEGTTVGSYSIAAGYQVEASGFGSVALGTETIASGRSSIALGEGTQATNSRSCALGLRTVATGPAAYTEGSDTIAKGTNSHASGDTTIATSWSQFSLGRFNKDDGNATNVLGNYFIIGNGSNDTSRSNCFRITSHGAAYGLSAFQSSGADYAEYFEWLDGNLNNEDRVGYFVTMQGSKIIKAESNEDYILGIVSAQPCIIGNSDEDWLGRWKHDEFGRFLTRKIESDEVMGEEYIPNPDYDSNQVYVERKDRKEWSAIGMMGVLAVRDDGTCKVNGFCTVKEGGIATTTSDRNGYRVIERVTENIVKVVFR